MESARRTPLYDLHRKLGARIIAFAGFAMPLNYRGIIEEHLAVRQAAGLFDLSHMGEFELKGHGALELLERLLTNSAAELRDGQAQYSLLCSPDGGVIDDLIVYRLEAERYLLCVNAANIGADHDWLTANNRAGAEFRDISEETALVAIQGPKACSVLEQLTKVDLSKIARYNAAAGEVAGAQALVARTGYTGEDGFELFVPAQRAIALFEALMNAGSGKDLLPCGLGARDTLRIEAGLVLYGHELDLDTNALEAGLGRFVKLKRDFVGAEALRAGRAAGLKKRLVGLYTDDAKSVARQGYKIFDRRKEVGVVTSGTFAPTFKRPLAMGYIFSSADLSELSDGRRVEVEIRGHRAAATLTALPFYRRDSLGGKPRLGQTNTRLCT